MTTSRKAAYHLLLVLVVLYTLIYAAMSDCFGSDIPGKVEDENLLIYRHHSSSETSFQRLSSAVERNLTYPENSMLPYLCRGNYMLMVRQQVWCEKDATSGKLEWARKGEDPYCVPACSPLATDTEERYPHGNMSVEQPGRHPDYVYYSGRFDCREFTDTDNLVAMRCKKESLPPVIVGTLVRIDCDDGYKPKTSTTAMRCEEKEGKGEWSYVDGKCLEQCRKPEVKENNVQIVKYDQESYSEGDAVVLGCKQGYVDVEKNGDKMMTCKARGKKFTGIDFPGEWDSDPLKCQAQCKKTDEDDKRNVELISSSTFVDGSMARYRCKEGYALSEGDWTLYCEKCNKVMVGASYTGCNTNDTGLGWRGKYPSCHEECGTPRQSNTAHHNSTGERFKRGREIQFTCNKSHLPKKNSAMKIKCEQQTPGSDLSQWKPQVPTCVPACHMIDTSRHEGLKPVDFVPGVPESPDKEQSLVRPNTKAHFRCEEGYTVVGEGLKTCTASGQWSGSEDFPTCEAQCRVFPKIDHGEPMMVVGVVHSSKYLEQGKTVQYRCDDKYVFNKAFPTSVNCEHATKPSSKPKWSSPLPQCEPACWGLFVIHNGGFDISDKSLDNGNHLAPLGTTVKFFCKEGFKLEGANVTTCSKEHQWAPKVPPYCQKLCPAPPKSQLAQPDPNNLKTHYSPEDTVTYVCQEGAVKPPNATMQVRCSGDGDDVAFVGPFPKCDSTCGTPPLVINAKIEWSDQKAIDSNSKQATIGSVIRYICDPKYVLRHTDIHSLKCLVSTGAKWTGNIPICDRTCVKPASDRTKVKIGKKCSANGRCRPGTEVEIHCKSGFYAPNTGLMKCEAKGPSEAVWSPGMPNCVPMCSYKELTNAEHTNKSVCNEEKYCIPGKRVQLECPRGYAFQGGTPEFWPLCNGTDQEASFVEEVPNCEEKFVEDRSEEVKKEKEERKRKEKEEAKKDKMVLIIILSVGGFVILAIIIGLVVFLVVKLKRKQSDGDQTERTAVDARSVSRVGRTERGPSTSRGAGRSGRDETKRTETTGSRRQSSFKRDTSTRSRKEGEKTSWGASARASTRNTTYDRPKMKT